MDTEAKWRGEFGYEYTARNRVDWRARIPFWKGIIDETGSRSVFEFGCNAGWNLSAIKRAYPDVQTYGHDINLAALDIAHFSGHTTNFEPHAKFELSFTAGVLIHIPPERLKETMKEIVGRSCDYVLAVEYEAPELIEIDYRGNSGMLWKGNYGDLYQALGLTLVEEYDAGPAFDRCTAWLLRK